MVCSAALLLAALDPSVQGEERLSPTSYMWIVICNGHLGTLIPIVAPTQGRLTIIGANLATNLISNESIQRVE